MDAGVYSLREYRCSSAQRNCLAALNNLHLCFLGWNMAVNATLKSERYKGLLSPVPPCWHRTPCLCASSTPATGPRFTHAVKKVSTVRPDHEKLIAIATWPNWLRCCRRNTIAEAFDWKVGSNRSNVASQPLIDPFC